MSEQYRFTIIGNDKTKAAFRSIRKGLKGVRGAASSTQVRFASLAGVAGLGALVNSSRQAIDSLDKTSQKLGLTTEALAGMRLAAELTGVQTNQLDTGIQRMTRRIAEAAQGSGEAQGALRELGLDAQSLAQLPIDQQFQQIAGAMENVESQSDKVRLGFKLFDSEGVALINTLELGAKGLQKAQQEAEDYGLALNAVEVAKVVEANDELTRVGKVVEGTANKITVKLAPIIGVVADKFVQASIEGDRMGKIVSKSIGFVVKSVGVFANGIHGIKVVIAGVKAAMVSYLSFSIGIWTKVAESAVIAANGVKVAFLKSFRLILQAGSRFTDAARRALADINAQINAPVEQPKFVQAMAAASDSLKAVAANARSEFQELIMSDMPSAVLEQRWAEIEAQATERAKATEAKIRAELSGDSQGSGGQNLAELEKQQREEERERSRISARLDRIREANMSELELINNKHMQEQEILRRALELEEITKEQFRNLSLKNDEKAAKAREKLDKASAKSRLALVSSTLSNMESFMSTGSKKMFAVQKAGALAQALVDVPAAVVSSFRNGGGYPWGLIPAGIMAAKGAAQISNIKRQSFGGGGSISTSVGGGGSASSGGSAASPARALPSGIGAQLTRPDERPQEPRTIINIHGDLIGDKAQTIFDEFSRMIEDADAVLIRPGTRQAQELAG